MVVGDVRTAALTDADYRDMASEIRDLIPLLMHSQTVADFRLLAGRDETQADCFEEAPDTLGDTPIQHRRQAG